ncbi:MAG: hypothetical protein RML74_00455 [Acidobacteriota bacterium]|nr:hypothetical protein [Acidobacteriota bacterium]
MGESERIIGEAILVDGRRGIRATMACPNCVSQPLRAGAGGGEHTGGSRREGECDGAGVLCGWVELGDQRWAGD